MGDEMIFISMNCVGIGNIHLEIFVNDTSWTYSLFIHQSLYLQKGGTIIMTLTILALIKYSFAWWCLAALAVVLGLLLFLPLLIGLVAATDENSGCF